MAEENTVTMTVENVDRLFSEIVVNGESHVSDRYTPPEPVQNLPAVQEETTPSQNNSSSSSPATSPAQSIQGQDVYGVELNNILHNFVDRVVTQGLADEETARQLADSVLQSAIDAINALIPVSASSSNKLADSASVSSEIENAINALDVAQAGGSGKFIQAVSETNGKISATEGTIDSSVSSGSDNPVSGGAVSTAIGVVQASVQDIEDLIPSQATSSNQLADKNFVNSSIATNTANFLGTYTSLADIEAIQNPTNNDYAFLQTTDSAGNTVFDRYKYNASSSEWLFEYELNNSSFTAQQWATINSGLTSTSVSDAINALDVASEGGAGKYIEAISEANGKISATPQTMDTAPTQNSTKACTSGGIYTALQNVTVPVDTAMSGTSENAVQNKVIKAYVDTAETNAKNLANATGTLAVAHGGTGQTSLDNVTVGASKNNYALDEAVDCDTAGNVSAKTVTLEGFTLVKGARFIINIKNSSTASNPTLNVNNTGAKALKTQGFQNAVISSGYYSCYYDGTDWFLDNEFAFTRARYANTGSRSSATSIIGCNSNASSVSKTIDIAGYGTTITGGAVILVKISYTNTASNPTFRIHDNFTKTYTTAKPIKVFGESPDSTNNLLKEGTYYCMYDGTNWNFFPYGTTNEVTADNMQSVSSKAVYDTLKRYTYYNPKGAEGTISNANDFPDGFYCNFNITNAPNGNWFFILTLTFNEDPTYKTQFAFQIANQSLYVRYRDGNGWSGWRII